VVLCIGVKEATDLDRWLGAPLRDDADVGDPVMFPPRKTGFNIFALESNGGSVKPRLVDIFQHVNVDNGIEMIPDFAGN
jgi:hypothetical protein